MLKRHLILSLSPLREGCFTIPLPEKLLDRAQAFVLPPSQLFVTGELTDILKASLPDRLLDHSHNAISEVLTAFSMGCPRVKDMSQSALKVAVLIVVCHKGHQFAPPLHVHLNDLVRFLCLFYELFLQVCVVADVP